MDLALVQQLISRLSVQCATYFFSNQTIIYQGRVTPNEFLSFCVAVVMLHINVLLNQIIKCLVLYMKSQNPAARIICMQQFILQLGWRNLSCWSLLQFFLAAAEEEASCACCSRVGDAYFEWSLSRLIYYTQKMSRK